MIDANLIRIRKLAVVGGAAAVGAAGAAFLLHGHLRQLAAGVTAGLAFCAASMLIEAYRRRGPLDASPAAKEKKARRTRSAIAIGTSLGAIALLVVRLLHAEWPAAGFCTGLFAFAGLWFSPLFWTRPNPRVAPSPRARMTSGERAVHVRYE